MTSASSARTRSSIPRSRSTRSRWWSRARWSPPRSVRESKGARTLFGRRGVRGLANVDITSEVAVRLAMAYDTVLKKGAVVCTSRDTSRSARALKRAIIAGLNLSGVHVMDLELSTVPLTRFQVRTQQAQGGISVRLASGDADSVEIRFMDEYGSDIDEGAQRKIERLLYREDFRRGVRGRHRRHRLPAEGDRVLYGRARIERPARATAAARVQGRARLLVRRNLDPDAQRARGALARVCWPMNPFAATSGAMGTGDDHDTRIKVIGDLVRTSGSDLGYVFDPDGETANDHRRPGRAVVGGASVARVVKLVCEQRPGARRAAGLGEPLGERLGERNGVPITWTKLSASHLMEVAGSGTVDFAASQEGGFDLAAFLPAVRRGRHTRASARPARRQRARPCRRSCPRSPKPTWRTTSCRHRGSAREP